MKHYQTTITLKIHDSGYLNRNNINFFDNDLNVNENFSDL